ncbi:MAG: helix-turn-helix transcriptional regulator [Clostridia bacterium]|nr:helix-turn-helix transcriptional regulator [Clostridia bacterium]
MSLRKLNNYFNVIGENLKELRLKKNLSQAQLANELNLLGINIYKNDISMIEANTRSVKDYELWGFIKVLNVKFEDLTSGIEKKLQQ